MIIFIYIYIEREIDVCTFIDFFTDGYVYVYAIDLRKIGCLFSFSYVSTASVFTVGRSKKNELATNENGIHISRLTKNNKRNLHISPRSSLTAVFFLLLPTVNTLFHFKHILFINTL